MQPAGGPGSDAGERQGCSRAKKVCDLTRPGADWQAIARLEGFSMRYLTAALALAFALGAVSAAQACPDTFKTASTPSQVVSSDDQGAPPSTKARIPSPPPKG